MRTPIVNNAQVGEGGKKRQASSPAFNANAGVWAKVEYEEDVPPEGGDIVDSEANIPLETKEGPPGRGSNASQPNATASDATSTTAMTDHDMPNDENVPTSVGSAIWENAAATLRM